ncbi:hypothetical protein VMCG_03160 [Cytospora schulzeri]|uniref:DSBA-like thioredoxin domain-containing protein n=1 Tax=Cytospora schulzeri TaxID=448051 RepID=A0A423WY51_9PEZI|nr:hypothetical protein VMCG_03160 [Valsa malicola]
MAPLTITIRTFSDTLCPWCYIGKKDLDRAMDIYKGQHPDVQFEVTWNPFYLNPKAKVSAYDKKDYYLAKFGPADAPASFARVEKEAAAQGLTMNWEGKCGNTRDSHDILADALFRGALEQGRDISDRSFLVETAVRVGLAVQSEGGGGDGSEGERGEDALLEWLDSGEARAEADALDRFAKEEVGITAVPSYVVQGRYRVGGKQGPEVFLRLFERIRLETCDVE